LVRSLRGDGYCLSSQKVVRLTDAGNARVRRRMASRCKVTRTRFGQRTPHQYPDRREHKHHNERALRSSQALFAPLRRPEPTPRADSHAEAVLAALPSPCFDLCYTLLTCCMVVTMASATCVTALTFAAQWLLCVCIPAHVALVSLASFVLTFPVTVSLLRHSCLLVLLVAGNFMHPRSADVVLFLEKCTRPCVLLAANVLLAALSEAPCRDL
jgi:hypothetical protein